MQTLCRFDENNIVVINEVERLESNVCSFFLLDVAVRCRYLSHLPFLFFHDDSLPLFTLFTSINDCILFEQIVML